MFTIEDLKEGKCAVKNDGTLEELQKVLELAFPEDDSLSVGGDSFYYLCRVKGHWGSSYSTNLQYQSVKDFLINELKRGDLVWVSDDDPEEHIEQAIFLTKIEGTKYPYIVVEDTYEDCFKQGLLFDTNKFKYATKVEEPEEVTMTIEEIEKALKIKNLKIVK